MTEQDCHHINVEDKHSRIKERKQLDLTRCIPPVPHELTSNRKHRQDLYSSDAHAVVGIIGGPDVECTGGIGVGKDGEPGVTKGEGEESSADLTMRNSVVVSQQKIPSA